MLQRLAPVCDKPLRNVRPFRSARVPPTALDWGDTGAVSQDNVERVRRGTEHWLRTGEPLWDDVDPDFEIHDFDIPDGGIYRGLEGFHEWIADVSRPFDAFAWEPLE